MIGTHDSNFYIYTLTLDFVNINTYIRVHGSVLNHWYILFTSGIADQTFFTHAEGFKKIKEAIWIQIQKSWGPFTHDTWKIGSG